MSSDFFSREVGAKVWSGDVGELDPGRFPFPGRLNPVVVKVGTTTFFTCFKSFIFKKLAALFLRGFLFSAFRSE